MDGKHSSWCGVHYSLEGTGLNLIGYNIDNNKCMVINNLAESIFFYIQLTFAKIALEKMTNFFTQPFLLIKFI